MKTSLSPPTPDYPSVARSTEPAPTRQPHSRPTSHPLPKSARGTRDLALDFFLRSEGELDEAGVDFVGDDTVVMDVRVVVDFRAAAR